MVLTPSVGSLLVVEDDIHIHVLYVCFLLTVPRVRSCDNSNAPTSDGRAWLHRSGDIAAILLG